LARPRLGPGSLTDVLAYRPVQQAHLSPAPSQRVAKASGWETASLPQAVQSCGLAMAVRKLGSEKPVDPLKVEVASPHWSEFLSATQEPQGRAAGE